MTMVVRTVDVLRVESGQKVSRNRCLRLRSLDRKVCPIGRGGGRHRVPADRTPSDSGFRRVVRVPIDGSET